MWQAQFAGFEKTDRKYRTDVLNRVRELVEFSFVVQRGSVYDEVSDEERMLLIGSAVERVGVKWVEDHPRQARWMSERGITVDQCVAAIRERMRVADAFTGWREVKRGAGTA